MPLLSFQPVLSYELLNDIKTFSSLPTLNFGILVCFIISERSTNISGAKSNRSLRTLETLIGRCVLESICSRATPLLSLGQMRKN